MRREKNPGAAPGRKGGSGGKTRLAALARRAGCAWLAGSLLWCAWPGPGVTAAAESRETAQAGLPTVSADGVLDLDAAGMSLTDPKAVEELIAQHPEAKEIRMFDSPMATADMEKLFDRYSPEIFFGFTIQIGPHIIRTDQTAFSTLHMSGETKEDPRHTSEELFPLRMCTRLKALDLGHNYLTDLSLLKWMPELEVLIISPNYGLKDIGPVANCKRLVYLECFNTPITDLSPLAGLKYLRDLNLTRDTEVKDLSPLYDLPNLERFWWGRMNGVPQEQKKIMREKHPGCRFKSVYDPTDGGWRRHSHFRELHSFFRTGVYVPFSE